MHFLKEEETCLNGTSIHLTLLYFKITKPKTTEPTKKAYRTENREKRERWGFSSPKVFLLQCQVNGGWKMTPEGITRGGTYHLTILAGIKRNVQLFTPGKSLQHYTTVSPWPFDCNASQMSSLTFNHVMVGIKWSFALFCLCIIKQQGNNIVQWWFSYLWKLWDSAVKDIMRVTVFNTLKSWCGMA